MNTGDVSAPRLAVIIPAHNEEAVIERCLESVLADPMSENIEILVACNGCTDRTAEIARSVSRRIRVLESPVASKHAALNLGDRTATAPHRAYLDADTVLSPSAIGVLCRLVEEPDAEAAALTMQFDPSGCSWPAREFHRIWSRSPYFSGPVLGAGLYALTETGRARFDEFPPVVGDDFFVASLIPPSLRAGSDAASFTPLIPKTLRMMLKVHIRHYGAHVELHEWLSREGRRGEIDDPPRDYGWLAPLARSPRNWPGLVFYTGVKAAAVVLGRQKARRDRMGDWTRDEGSRATASA